MAKFLIEATYTTEGAKGLAREGGTSRRKAVEKALKPLKGKIEAFYYAFGDADVFVIIDVPDAVTAAALSLAVAQHGTVSLKTHVLFTTQEMDRAARMSVNYRGPGE